MKILHTSDWHIGRSLYGRKRYDEFAAFLDWLGDTIEAQHVDALLVAGDVFDNSTPSNRAQALYYRFLCRVAASSCRHIVIIAGNHDSPSFLNAPRELLRTLNVHVVGAMCEHLVDEVIVLRDDQDTPRAIVCAVPYLRDRDIRTVEAGESIEEKNLRLIEGLKQHYADVCAIAEQQRAELEQAGNTRIPIIAMGHLFAAGGETVEGDGVRELYVGSLAHVRADAFPASVDYFALGHLHVPQRVGNLEHIRYSGSPIPMGYGEAKQQKQVVIIDFDQRDANIESLQVPCFQPLERIAGSIDEVLAQLDRLKQNNSRAWLEIEYTGSEISGNLREIFDEALAGTRMEIRRIRNRRMIERVMHSIEEDETLDDLNPDDVFSRCLETFEVPQEERGELTTAYQQIVQNLREQDTNAE